MNTGQARCGTIITMGLARYQQKETNMDIFNLEDRVIGSMHQITVENHTETPIPSIRVDGSLLPANHEFHQRVVAMLASWSDHFEGVPGKETVVANMRP